MDTPNAPAPAAAAPVQTPQQIAAARLGNIEPSRVDTTPKPPAPTDKKEPAKAPDAPKGEQTYTVEFNGQKVELTAKQIFALQEKSKQFDITAKAKAELEQGLARMLTQLDEDPLALYAKRGKDANALITDKFKKLLEADQQDPKERELTELRAERESRKAADEAAAKQKLEAEKQVKQKAIYTQILQEMDKVITEKGLPKDQYTVDRMLRIMASGKRVKGSAFTVQEAAAIVEQEEIKHMGFIAKALPSDRLKAIFGKDIIKKLNSEEVAALKAADKQVIQDNKGATDKKPGKSKLTPEERRRYNDVAGI